MKRFNHHLTVFTLLAAIGATAFAAAGFDRLRDHVIIGQGTATDKVIELDIGQGASNPKVVADGSSGLISFSGGGFIPTGAIIPFGGSTAPAGWLLGDGSCVSRVTYADLFAVFSTTYGTCDSGGGTNSGFNLPDLRGRVAAGKDDMGGSAASRLTSTHTGIAGTDLGAVGGSQQVTGTIGGSQSIQHTHNIAHAHGVMLLNNLENLRAATTLNDAITTLDNSNTSTITSQGSASGSDNSGYLMAGTVEGPQILYSSGALSPPSGSDGANAASGNMSANSTVNGSNFTFTDGTGGNAQPTIVLNYIIKT